MHIYVCVCTGGIIREAQVIGLVRERAVILLLNLSYCILTSFSELQLLV